MNGTPLIIGEPERAALTKLRDLAAEKPVNMQGITERLKLPKAKAQHMKQMTAQTIDIPMDYQVTFSIETGHPAGACRHMSMSVGKKGRVPNQHAVWMVAELLGFVGSLEQCDAIWLEDLKGHGEAVNVVQAIMATGGTA